MTHSYNITGMTCNGCVAKAKNELLKLGEVTEANVQLPSPQATITMLKHIPTDVLQNALRKAGHYTITEEKHSPHKAAQKEETGTASWLQTYKPLLLVFSYILLASLIAATSDNGFDAVTGMRIFMSGFFLIFSFFKLLDLNGFADSYSTYDIIAKRFRSWGFIYAFIELLLGIAYAVNFQPVFTNVVTLAVMSVSIIGVLQSVLNKRQIRCACLGAVFNLPVSTVTIVEDALMIAMSGIMIVPVLL